MKAIVHLLSLWILVRTRNISDTLCREKDNTIVFNNFFSENFVVYEIMWDYLVEPDRPQLTIQYIPEKILFSCWVKKTRKKCPLRIYNTAFQRQQWLRESVCMLQVHCLSYLFSLKHSICHYISSTLYKVYEWLCPVLCIIGTSGSLQIAFKSFFSYFSISRLSLWISSCCVCWTHTHTHTHTQVQWWDHQSIFSVWKSSQTKELWRSFCCKLFSFLHRHLFMNIRTEECFKVTNWCTCIISFLKQI
jgi:hypothetical protein